MFSYHIMTYLGWPYLLFVASAWKKSQWKRKIWTWNVRSYVIELLTCLVLFACRRPRGPQGLAPGLFVITGTRRLDGGPPFSKKLNFTKFIMFPLIRVLFFSSSCGHGFQQSENTLKSWAQICLIHVFKGGINLVKFNFVVKRGVQTSSACVRCQKF